MKGIYLIAIAFLASWAVITAEESISVLEKDDECPAKDTCPPKLIFHETDCNKYYECKGGEKKLQNCLSGLHFSKAWRGCVKPSVSECIDHNEAPAVGCRNNEDLVPHECDCHKFYECKKDSSSAFRKILRECLSGEHFSKRLRRCVTGNRCDDDIPVRPECQEGVNLPHECQCEKYYLCKDNKKILRDCEKGSHFSNYTLTCERGPCPENGERRCEENTKKKHECGCIKYYICLRGEWILSECKSGDHFSPTRKECMRRQIAGCEPPCKNPNNEKWHHECDCRLYYQCIDQKQEIFGCPWGEYFDKNRLKCDAENKVNCKNTWDK